MSPGINIHGYVSSPCMLFIYASVVYLFVIMYKDIKTNEAIAFERFVFCAIVIYMT